MSKHKSKGRKQSEQSCCNDQPQNSDGQSQTFCSTECLEETCVWSDGGFNYSLKLCHPFLWSIDADAPLNLIKDYRANVQHIKKVCAALNVFAQFLWYCRPSVNKDPRDTPHTSSCRFKLNLFRVAPEDACFGNSLCGHKQNCSVRVKVPPDALPKGCNAC